MCRLEDLEKENAILKEKIHHLDDMLKSQQRKLRQMIEQVKKKKIIPGSMASYLTLFNI